MPLSVIEEYSLRSIAVFGSNMHSQITVGNLTLPKAVLSTGEMITATISYHGLSMAQRQKFTVNFDSHSFKTS